MHCECGQRASSGGSGVCGAIFKAAGWYQLQKTCDAIGHCDIGSAAITPAFNLDAKYIIHAVGPVWSKALQACNDFIAKNSNYDIDILFAVLDDKILQLGKEELQRRALEVM